MKTSIFFKNDYVDQASYDNLRKIASVIDGQKNTSRKILYTILTKNIKDEIKVKQLDSKVAEFTEYLHGDMCSVIVGLAQKFTGSNNIPLLSDEGNFGTRFSPEASASRYIYTLGTKEFFNIFKKEDIDVLIKQTFEGQEIEPRFYVPNLPMLLINGSEGVSSGFAQKILPRNPQKIKKYIQDYLKNNLKLNDSNSLEPYYKGFKGIIESGNEPGQWLIKGTFKRIGINKIQISEVPIGYSLKSYLKVLDDLEDKKIIQNYRDKSEDDNFLFDVSINSKDLASLDDETLLDKLKLIKRITENYTCIDENNKIHVFNSAKEIIDYYIKIKLEYIQKRKTFQISKMISDIKFDFSKYLFIKNIVEEKLKINKRKKEEIENDLCKIEKILKKDDSYDYLLNLNILSLTKEKMDKLEEDIKMKKSQLDLLSQSTPQTLWSKEI
jgi:DNA topoisomerase-2